MTIPPADLHTQPSVAVPGGRKERERGTGGGIVQNSDVMTYSSFESIIPKIILSAFLTS